MTRITIVMPMRNEIRTLPVVIGALRTLLDSDPECDAVICDNGSTDGTREALDELKGQVNRLVVVSTDATTPSDVRNCGAQHASGALFAFVDGDCEIGGDYTAAIRTAFSDGRVGAAGSWVAMPERAGLVERTWQRLHEDMSSGDVVALNGANLVVRADIFRVIGGFDSSLRTNEDEELCHRVRAAGWVVRCDRSIRAIHHGNPKTLREFYRRALWHAQSIPAMVARGKIDKGIAALLLHVLFLGTAIPLAVRALYAGSLSAAALALLLSSAVPLASLVYRAAGRPGSSVNWPMGALMYWIFFHARVHGSAVALLSSGAASWKRVARAAG